MISSFVLAPDFRRQQLREGRYLDATPDYFALFATRRYTALLVTLIFSPRVIISRQDFITPSLPRRQFIYRHFSRRNAAGRRHALYAVIARRRFELLDID